MLCMLLRGISRLWVGMLVVGVHINWLIVKIYLLLYDFLDKILLSLFGLIRSINFIDILFDVVWNDLEQIFRILFFSYRSWLDLLLFFYYLRNWKNLIFDIIIARV